MKPKTNDPKSQRSSKGKTKKQQTSGHGLGDDAKLTPPITETAKQKLPKEKIKKKDKETRPEVIVGKLRKSKSELKTLRDTNKRSPEGAVKPKEKKPKKKITKEKADKLEAATTIIKEELSRKTVVNEKNPEKSQGEIGVGRKRKIAKKEKGVSDIGTVKQSQEDSQDELGVKQAKKGVKQAKKRAKRIAGRKKRKSGEIESRPDISEKPETTDKRKKQKLNTGTKREETKGDCVNKEGVLGTVDAQKDVAREGEAEEVNGHTDNMAKAAKFVGAHMSVAGGLENAVKGAVTTGAKAFALFLRSQRQWAAKPLEDKPAETFRKACQEHKFSPDVILPHGSYLLNCGSPNAETLRKSREALADELNRCEKLGLTRYNFHPGSTCGKITVEECLDKIGESINIVHQQTNKVMTVIENMSRQGNTVGGKFEELHGIIERVKDKSRIGVCLDTCHAFAAGFDLSSESGYQDMMKDFEKIVGLKYLVAVHLNDSKGKVGSHLDRHEKIGQGQIGIKAFQRLMNDPRFDNIPLILETPVESGLEYAQEIKLLYSLVN